MNRLVAPVVVALAVGLAACGANSSSTAAHPSTTAAPAPAAGTSPGPAETNPAGDIPDNIAYVPYRPPGGGYVVTVPEGWSRIDAGSAVSFTDKLNTVRIELRPLSTAPTEATVRGAELPGIGAGPGATITTVSLPAGAAVKASFQADSPPDPVTGKSRRDAVERYSLWKGGTEAVLTLSGPVGADNVDPYKKITDSFSWQ